MANKNQNGSKNSNNNGGNKGGIPKGALCAEGGALGRARKKAEAKARQAAKAAISTQAQQRAVKEAEAAYASSSQELGRLVDGHYGTYGIKEDDKIVIVRVTHVKGSHHANRIIYIDHSQVEAVPASDRNFLPVISLKFPEPKQVVTGETFAWQKKVHTFLLRHLAPFFVARIPGLGYKWQKENKNISLPELPKTKPAIPEVLIDTSSAMPVSTSMFMGVKHDMSHLYVEEDAAGNKAYFKTWRAAGNNAVSLMSADIGHSLGRVFRSQESVVHVHLADLSFETRPYDGDLKNMKDARECLRQYLRQVAMSFGLKAKTEEDAAALRINHM